MERVLVDGALHKRRRVGVDALVKSEGEELAVDDLVLTTVSVVGDIRALLGFDLEEPCLMLRGQGWYK